MTAKKEEWVSLTWPEFCAWLQGKRVMGDSGPGDHDSVQTLHFNDGSSAELTSEKTDGTPGYSEWTPGSSGHLKTPTVRVRAGR